MATFFTSDHHFDHKNIISLANRPFKNMDAMNDALIRNWNDVVKPDDVVYHLADFTFGGVDVAAKFFQRLNGHIKVLGYPWHHDSRWINSGRMVYVSASGHIVEIMPPMVVLEDVAINQDGRGVPAVLCHYPIYQWDRKHYGAWHLHGHSHGTLVWASDDMLALDVGVDCHNFYPIRLEQIAQHMQRKENAHK